MALPKLSGGTQRRAQNDSDVCDAEAAGFAPATRATLSSQPQGPFSCVRDDLDRNVNLLHDLAGRLQAIEGRMIGDAPCSAATEGGAPVASGFLGELQMTEARFRHAIARLTESLNRIEGAL